MKRLTCALALWALPACAEMTYLGSYHWQKDLRYFGGLSGIELSADGATFLVISDDGIFARGTIARDGADQIITDVQVGPFNFIPQSNIREDGEETRDSEGLAVTADGRVFVSYEGPAVVREEHLPDGVPDILPVPPEFTRMQGNGALEALAVDADGVLYTIPERSGRALRPFPVYRFDGAWEVAFEMPRRGLLVPVGADIGPDGRLYVLERDFNGFGFSSRIRRFALDGTGEETLLETAPGVHDNLEGITLWQDAQGLRITLVSDSNFRRSQRTELVEYRLTE